jgi:membrane fusion protein, multidrug efflux system
MRCQVDQTAPIAKRKRDARRASRSLRPNSVLLAGGTVILFAAAGIFGHDYWVSGRFCISTDDAYVQADNVIISPQVSGYISAVPVADNQQVKAGQVLARIDDRDYRVALASTQANVAAPTASIDDLSRQIAQQNYMVSEARAVVTGDQAALNFAEDDQARYAAVSRSGAGTMQSAERAGSTAREMHATLDHDTAAVGAAQTELGVLGAQLAKAKANLAQEQAMLHQAQLNLGYTTITAPISGTVGERSLRVGQYVQVGTQLMAVVPLQAVYITANYKETQLTDVHPGQKVSITVDMFPGVTVHGVVNSIAPNSGEEFALLPPDNATGNFTKIVQRVPVKITIDQHDPLFGSLRPGMSVEPTIDTKRSAS